MSVGSCGTLSDRECKLVLSDLGDVFVYLRVWLNQRLRSFSLRLCVKILRGVRSVRLLSSSFPASPSSPPALCLRLLLLVLCSPPLAHRLPPLAIPPPRPPPPRLPPLSRPPTSGGVRSLVLSSPSPSPAAPSPEAGGVGGKEKKQCYNGSVGGRGRGGGLDSMCAFQPHNAPLRTPATPPLWRWDGATAAGKYGRALRAAQTNAGVACAWESVVRRRCGGVRSVV